ncbi:Rab family GTPase [Sulfurimonas sp. NW9]
MITKKVVLIGDFATGKTSLIRRYVDNQFSDDYLTTIGVKISKKYVQVSEELELQLMIWDIEGRTDVKDTNPAYVLGAHGVIVVGDITRQSSIDNISLHLKLAQNLLKNVPAVVALNKADLLIENTQIKSTVSQLRDSLEKVEEIFETSAKDGRNVEELFLSLSKAILK